jgi:uncharacterized membrane protein
VRYLLTQNYKVIAMNTEQQIELHEPAESAEDNVLAAFKPFLLGIAGLGFIMGILVLLPMLLTYLSEGDLRPPSQIHHADPVGKSDHTVYKPMNAK